MLGFLATLHNGFSRLLPFATPGTPLVQDLVHFLALCTALYYGPQIQAYVQARMSKDEAEHQGSAPTEGQNGQHVRAGDRPDADHQHAQNQHAMAGVPDDGHDNNDDDDDDDDEDDDNLPDQEGFNIPPGFADQDAGPAGPAAPRGPPSSRTVGAKKAKSLARKDQRRAYHEFMRSQGEAQRAREAEGAQERERAVAAERARRAAAAAEVEARLAREREDRRVREARERDEDMRRREEAVGLVRAGLRARRMCELGAVAQRVGGGVDRSWVEGLVRASGLLRLGGESLVLLTESGWVVQVRRADLHAMYDAVLDAGADDRGQVPYAVMGDVLQGLIESAPA